MKVDGKLTIDDLDSIIKHAEPTIGLTLPVEVVVVDSEGFKHRGRKLVSAEVQISPEVMLVIEME